MNQARNYHFIYITELSLVILTINGLAFVYRDVTSYLFVLDMVYIIGNSAHLVALSISSSGLSIEDEKKSA